MTLPRTSLWSGALLVACGVALLAQQQAAEAPATDRRVQTRPAVAGLHGLVTAGHPIASSAGLKMLLKGGNAFDAAVAVGGMIALGEPEMNGIGGNGFVTLYDKKSGKVMSLAMAGAAPKGIKPAEMTPETLNAGMNAGIVPGNLGGYLYLLDRFGTMSLAEVFAPAIEYAEKGDGTQGDRAARVGQSGTHAGHPHRRQDGNDDGRRRSAADSLCDGL